MRKEIYKIMTYKVDEAPALGYYEPSAEIIVQMVSVLERIPKNGDHVSLEIPNIDGATLEARRIGAGLELSATVATPSRDKGPHVLVLLALDEASADAACTLARQIQSAFGWPEQEVDPDWLEAMKGRPATPFTVVAPNYKAMGSIAESKEALERFRLTTGFFQAFIGAVLKQSGVPALPSTDAWQQRATQQEAPEGDEQIDGIDMAAALQTGGEPHDQLIIAPGEDGYPEIYAHIIDLEVDAFRVDFVSDGTINVDTEKLTYLTLSDEILHLVLDLHGEAQEAWGRILKIMDEVGDPGEIDWSELDTDPLEHLYTRHRKREVPGEVAKEMRNLGLAPPSPPRPEGQDEE